MYDLVGDGCARSSTPRSSTSASTTARRGLIHFPYTIERGVRFPDEPIRAHGHPQARDREPRAAADQRASPERAIELGQAGAIQGEAAKSTVWAPLLVGGEATGVISLQNLDREHAFTESDVALLTTLAASLSVALENARLIDETRQRAAELAIVNEVGQALAASSTSMP